MDWRPKPVRQQNQLNRDEWQCREFCFHLQFSVQQTLVRQYSTSTAATARRSQTAPTRGGRGHRKSTSGKPRDTVKRIIKKKMLRG